jgi:hypothetical protein
LLFGLSASMAGGLPHDIAGAFREERSVFLQRKKTKNAESEVLLCTCSSQFPVVQCTQVGLWGPKVGMWGRSHVCTSTRPTARAMQWRHVHMHVHQMCMSPMMSPLSLQITDVSSHLVCPPHQSAETEHPGPGRREPATTRRMGTTQTTQPPPPILIGISSSCTHAPCTR